MNVNCVKAFRFIQIIPATYIDPRGIRGLKNSLATPLFLALTPH